MRAKRIIAFPVLCALLALGLFALAGCGGSGDEKSTATSAEATGSSAETEEDTSGEPEPGDDSGGSAPAPSGNAARGEKVEIDNFAYKPDPVTIEEGGKVIWKNEDSVPHTATAEDGSFDTGPIEEGKLGSETFKEAGTYEYVCSIHPQMHGTIEVVPAG
jgi:plastocyanin